MGIEGTQALECELKKGFFAGQWQKLFGAK